MFKALYDYLEETFFFTLDRKLAGNLLPFALCGGILPLGLYFWLLRGTTEPGQTEILAGWLLLAGLGSLAYCLCCYLFLRRLIVLPIRKLIGFFDDQNEHRDLSQRMTATTRDEYAELVASYNGFIERLPQPIDTVRNVTVKAAYQAARTLDSTRRTAQGSATQRSLTEEIYLSTGESQRTVEEIAEAAQLLSISSADNLEAARTSLQEMREIESLIGAINSQFQVFNTTVDELNAKSDIILKTVALIDTISRQTNLLAINAAVEAARAGQHGKSFAVVANEVKELADRVKLATDEVEENLAGMKKSIEMTASEKDRSLGNTLAVHQAVTALMQRFERMVADYESNRDKLTAVAASIEELSATNEGIFSRVEQAKGASAEVASNVTLTERAITDLFTSVEVLQEEMAQFKIGCGQLEEIHTLARSGQEFTRTVLEQIAADGVDVFDQQYRSIPGTQPEKFQTCYDDRFDREIQGFIDRLRQSVPGVIYALALDRCGYAPTHHSEFSRAQSGDPQQDLLYSRHKRFFRGSDAEIRRAENLKPSLFQTILRDTGEIINDLSLPIHVHGRHWGAFIVGLKTEQFLHNT